MLVAANQIVYAARSKNFAAAAAAAAEAASEYERGQAIELTTMHLPAVAAKGSFGET